MVAEYKKQIVAELAQLLQQYPIIGVVNLEGLPASQYQAMRAELRGKVKMFMTKKRLMKLAMESVKDKVNGIEHLELI